MKHNTQIMNNQLANIFTERDSKSDWMIRLFLAAYFIFGLSLAAFHDTWSLSIVTGGLCLGIGYISRWILPRTQLRHYVISAVFGIFTVQFIYQMQGMFEMQFFAFVGSAMLTTYRNWKLQIPLAVIVLVHHCLFGLYQFTDVEGIDFLKPAYIPFITFLFHVVRAIIIFFIFGLWAYHAKRTAELTNTQSFKIGQLQEAGRQKDLLMAARENLKQTNACLLAANHELQTIFDTVEEVLFSVDTQLDKTIQISRACEKVYGFFPTIFYV